MKLAALIAMALGALLIMIPVGEAFQQPFFQMAGWVSLFGGTVALGILQLVDHFRRSRANG